VKTDLASLDPATRATFEKLGAETVSHLAVLPSHAAMTMGDKDGKAIRRVIDAGRKGGAKTFPALAAALDDSRKHQESMVMFVNLAELLGSEASNVPIRAMSFGMGKRDAALALRVTLLGAASTGGTP
jgi:hypothetical protein